MLSRASLRLFALSFAALSFANITIAANKPTNPPVAQEAIEQRQKNFEQIGGAFKTIRDEVRARNSNMEAISESINTIHALAQELPSWFPAGTGPEAGVETEALPVIWKDQAGFAAAAQKLRDASESMRALANSGDVSKVASGVATLGGACKNCHDNYRMD